MPSWDCLFPFPQDDDPSDALRKADPLALGEMLARPELSAWTLQDLNGQGLALAGLIRVKHEWPRVFSYPIHPVNAGVIQRRLALVGVVNHAFLTDKADAVQILMHPNDRNGNKVAEGIGFRIMEPAGPATGEFDRLVLPCPRAEITSEELGGIDIQAAVATYLDTRSRTHPVLS